ncbi:head-tail connector protein [Methylorubrum sp. SB2]|uniref:head-tail connector protein n=1 Tax=Methylorubrum subtropicum TaxID=3138812 RepID=UPI00313B5903
MLPGYARRYNRRVPSLVAAPAVEPVALADLKLALKIDGTDEDGLLTALIGTARRLAEDYTRRAFITQTWLLTQDSFSSYAEDVPPAGVVLAPSPTALLDLQTVHLPRGPIQSVTSVKVTSPAGVESTVAASTYWLDKANSDLVLTQGQSWPTDLRDAAGVAITYKAGYGDAATDVPADIRQAVQLQAAALYEGCGDVAPTVAAILDPYRLPEAFGIL